MIMALDVIAMPDSEALGLENMLFVVDWADCDRLGNIPLGAGWAASSGASTGFIDENRLLVDGWPLELNREVVSLLSLLESSDSTEGKTDSVCLSPLNPLLTWLWEKVEFDVAGIAGEIFCKEAGAGRGEGGASIAGTESSAADVTAGECVFPFTACGEG